MTKVEIIKYKVGVITNNKQSRRDIAFIRIGTKSTSFYIKVTTQFNLYVLLPLIKMSSLSRSFLNSMSRDILETIYWSEDESIHDSEIERCNMHNNSSSNCSKSSSASSDNLNIP